MYTVTLKSGRNTTCLLSQLIVGSGEGPAQNHHAEYGDRTVGQTGRTRLHGGRALACKTKKTHVHINSRSIKGQWTFLARSS